MASRARTQRRTLMPKQRRAIKLQQWHIHPADSELEPEEEEEDPPPPPPARWQLLLLPVMPIAVDEVGLPVNSRLILPLPSPLPLLVPLPFDFPLYVTMPVAATSSSGGSSIVRSVMAWPLPKCLLKLLKSLPEFALVLASASPWTAFAGSLASASASVWVPVTDVPNCICGCLMSFSYLRFALLWCWMFADIVILLRWLYVCPISMYNNCPAICPVFQYWLSRTKKIKINSKHSRFSLWHLISLRLSSSKFYKYFRYSPCASLLHKSRSHNNIQFVRFVYFSFRHLICFQIFKYSFCLAIVVAAVALPTPNRPLSVIYYRGKRARPSFRLSTRNQTLTAVVPVGRPLICNPKQNRKHCK